MSTFDAIWNKLRGSKSYREEFVADQLKRSIPFQARALMEHRGWKQPQLAEQSGISQGAISRAIDPSYGNLTLNTIVRLAAGFDVAFIGRFVPFSELARWYVSLPDEQFDIPSFGDEDEHLERASVGLSALADPTLQALFPIDPERRPTLGLIDEQSSRERQQEQPQAKLVEMLSSGTQPPSPSAMRSAV